MLAQILESELLTNLSDQQQQIVAGGLASIDKAVGTYYDADAVGFINQAGSGLGGSFVNTGIEQAQVRTGSFETLNTGFGGWGWGGW